MNRELYRFEDHSYSKLSFGIGEIEEYSTEYRILLFTYPIIKETEHGFWIENVGFGKKFVKKNSKKRFACVTKLQAWLQFQARKKRQKQIYLSRLERVEWALKQKIPLTFSTNSIGFL